MLGIPIFLGVIYCLFFFAINIGGAFQDFFDLASRTIFVNGLAQFLLQHHAPAWCVALFANGIGRGINTTVTFIPVIGALFLFLSFLEDSGYMARAAFVVDRAMQAVGLPGKSFVPMIIGFGCNVPAVMAARTLENQRDRILTIMMSPFMSCGARLAIYAVFVSAFFPHHGQNIIFCLYVIGMLMAIATSFLLRQTVLSGDSSPLILELPAYHVPHLKTVLLHAWQRLKGFLFRAGKLIVPICVLIGFLNSYTLSGALSMDEANPDSLLSLVGKTFSVIFAPLGIHADNWPASVGLVTGILAKEVVVGTLNTLYTQGSHLATVITPDFHFWQSLWNAACSIPEHLGALVGLSTTPDPAAMSNEASLAMSSRFDGQVGAFAYLLFVLLYFPCVSTTAAMLRELNRGWTLFSVLWSTGMAYAVAVIFYQLATVFRHPIASFFWVAGIIGVVSLVIISIVGVSLRRKI